jgi:D-inositol-3-phosphate glycosyltransferase
MRVVVSFPHRLGSPGIGTTAWHQVVALARAGAEVTVVCTSVVRPLPEDAQVRVLQSLGPVRHRMVGVARAYLWHDLVASKVVAKQRPDVVHCWPRSVLRTARAAARVGSLSVREAPSPYTRVAIGMAQKGWADLGLRPPPGHFHQPTDAQLDLEDREFRAVDLITVGSSEAAATFSGLDVDVAVVPYGYDPDRFSPSEHPALDPPTAVFVGRCEPGKGIHVLLRAWLDACVPAESRLLLCGDLTPEVANALSDLLGIPGVEHLGKRDDIWRVLAEADLLVLPSFSEGSALAVYEAIGAGVVPLVSRASGAQVRDGVNALLHSPGDTTALASQLGTLLRDPQQLARLKQGVLGSRSEWIWDRAGSRMLAAWSARL